MEGWKERWIEGWKGQVSPTAEDQVFVNMITTNSTATLLLMQSTFIFSLLCHVMLCGFNAKRFSGSYQNPWGQIILLKTHQYFISFEFGVEILFAQRRFRGFYMLFLINNVLRHKDCLNEWENKRLAQRG